MNINEHPIYQNIYDLCQEIEKLPASEQATKVVMMASALENPVRDLLEQKKVLMEALGYGTPWPIYDVLRCLSHAASPLLLDHDCDHCDHCGHEIISSNIERALKMATAIEKANQALGEAAQ